MTKNLPKQSHVLEKPSSEIIDGLDWSGLYGVLENLIVSLKSPGDSLGSYHKAIESARAAETKAMLIFVRMSRYKADCKRSLANSKLIYKKRMQLLMADPDFKEFGKSKEERQLYVEGSLVEDQKVVNEDDERFNRLHTFLECVDRTLSDIKHHREDVGRRVKVLSVENQIHEV